MNDTEELLIAPENFSMVEYGVYRSAFPRSKNLPFLKSLNLKSVIPLVPEDIPEILVEFYTQNNIVLKQHGLNGNKYPFKELEFTDVIRILKDILNTADRPVLIHCNKGKHRTGSIIGCLRKTRGWSLSSIINEYYSFALPKVRLEDQLFIQSFDPEELNNPEYDEIQDQSDVQDKKKKKKKEDDDDDDD